MALEPSGDVEHGENDGVGARMHDGSSGPVSTGPDGPAEGKDIVILGMHGSSVSVGSSEGFKPMPTPSTALSNLRTFIILIVLAVHAVEAYLGSSPPFSFRFDDPPYQWRSIPIIDSARWLGFDLFCGFQDIYLISLLFLLSGLFVWPSLVRKGSRVFVHDRLLRIGIPFVLAVGLLMPIAHYPVYRVTAIDPGLAAFWQHWLALPFWPSGPMWFLWILLVFDLCAAGLHQFAPGSGDRLGQMLGQVSARPKLFLIVLLSASALAYVPLALVFTPWAWFHVGPFSFQLCRPLHDAVYFFAGVGVGAYGIERGLLASDGWLVRRWAVSGAAAAVSYLWWLGMVGLAMASDGSSSLTIQVLQALSFVLCCAAGCMFMIGFFLRFANRPLIAFATLKEHAYGMYLNHYVFSIWLQYALLELALFAAVKAAVVYAGTVLLSWWASVATLRCIPTAARIIGSDRRVLPRAH